jgi:hypothetical protein
MKVGITLPNLGEQATRENVLESANQAEKEVFDSVGHHKNSLANKNHNQHMRQLLTAAFQLNIKKHWIH